MSESNTTTTSIPNAKVLHHAAKIAMEEDCPILLDYYTDSVNGGAFLGQHTTTLSFPLIAMLVCPAIEIALKAYSIW